MASQRVVKNVQSIHSAFQVANDEINRLQIKDAQLHSSILNLREKIQSNRKERPCACCKILEEQITLVKSQDQQKISQLQTHIRRLQQERVQLENDLRLKNEELCNNYNDEEQIQIERLGSPEESGVSLINKISASLNEQYIERQKTALKIIEDKALMLKIKEKKERELIKHLRRSRDVKSVGQSLSREEKCIVDSQVSIPSKKSVRRHRKLGSTDLANPNESPQADYEIFQRNQDLQDKLRDFQEIVQRLNRQIQQRQRNRQIDSNRISSLVNESENHRKEIQNLVNQYENRLVMASQDNDREVHDWELKARQLERQKMSMNASIENLVRDRDSLTLEKSIREETINHLRTSLSSLESNYEQKSVQYNRIQQQKDKLAAETAKISREMKILSQQKINAEQKWQEQTAIKNSISLKYTAEVQKGKQLKKKLYELEAQLPDLRSQLKSRINSNERQSQEVASLKIIIDQNLKLLQEKDNYGQELVNQLNRLQERNHHLAQQNSRAVMMFNQQVSEAEKIHLHTINTLQAKLNDEIAHLRQELLELSKYYEAILAQKDQDIQLVLKQKSEKHLSLIQNEDKTIIIELEHRLKQANSNYQSLNQALQQATSENSTLIQNLQQADSNIQGLNRTLQQADAHIVELNNILYHKQNQINEIVQVIHQKDLEINELAQKSTQQYQQQVDLANKFNLEQQKCRELTCAKEAAQSSLTDLSLKNEQNIIQIAILTHQVDKITSILQQTQANLQSTVQGRDQLSSDLLQLETANNNLKLELKNSNSLYQEQIASKSDQIKQLISFNYQLSTDLKQTSEKNILLMDKVTSLETSTFSESMNRKNILSTLQEDKKEIQSLKLQLAQQKNSKAMLSKQLQELKKEKQELISAINFRENHIRHQQTLIDEKQCEFSRMADVIERQAIQHANQLAKIKDNNQRQLNKLQQQLYKVNKELQLKNNTITELRNKSGSKADKYILPSEIEQLKATIVYLNQQIISMQAEYKDLAGNHEDLLEKYQKETQTTKKLREEIEDQKYDINELKEEVHNVDMKNKDKISSQTAIQNELTRQKTDLSAKIQQLRQRNQELQFTLKDKERSLKSAESKVVELTKSLETKINQFDKERSDLINKLHEKEREISKHKSDKEENIKFTNEKNQNYERKIHDLQDSLETFRKEMKNKDREHADLKKTLERNVAHIAEEKRKGDQTFLKEIAHLKKDMEALKKDNQDLSLNGSRIKPSDEEKKKEFDSLKKSVNQSGSKVKNLQTELSLKDNDLKMKNEEKRSLELTISQLKDKLAAAEIKSQEISQTKSQLENKTKTIHILQDNLKKVEQHYKRIEQKYNAITKQLTQKNLSQDFLWMQLQQLKVANKNLQDKTKDNRIDNNEVTNSLQIQQSVPKKPIKQGSPISDDASKLMEEIRKVVSSGVILEAEQPKQWNPHEQPIYSETEMKMSLPVGTISKEPFTSKSSLFMNKSLGSSFLQSKEEGIQSEFTQIEKKIEQLQKQKHKQQEQIKQIEKKSVNMMMQHTLSDVLSDSEQQDEINDIISNKNSNNSRRQGSVSGFSEYSRIKSTQSETTHKQVEQKYKNDMKNNLMIAKVSKNKKK